MQRYYSKIYWHFTGSPDVEEWANVKMPKEIMNKAKPSSEAVQTLKKILSSHRLIASCTEQIWGEIRTRKFCCVCDIPFKDLIYHTKCYGKAAIGFSAKSIHEHFNPVLYLERDFPIPEDITIDTSIIMLDSCKQFDDVQPFGELINYILGLDKNPQYNKFLLSYLGEMRQLIKITKFSENDNETFYREREWRSKYGDFIFELDDVEAIIVPKEFIHEIKSELLINKYGTDIPIIPFEFIEKI